MISNEPVNQVIDLEILVVLAEGIEQRLRHFDPAHVAEKLQDGEERDVEVRCVLVERIRHREADVEVGEGLRVDVGLARHQELAGKQRGEQVGEHRDGGNLQEAKAKQ